MTARLTSKSESGLATDQRNDHEHYISDNCARARARIRACGCRCRRWRRRRSIDRYFARQNGYRHKPCESDSQYKAFHVESPLRLRMQANLYQKSEKLK